MALEIGARLGPYEIQSAIGAGGMGEVYRALDTNLGRQVAIKVLPDGFAHDPERLARFEREAKTLASLNHPNIAIIHGLEKANGVRALVMELIEGPTLADRIAQGPIPLGEALPIALQIAEALEAAHEQAVIHRDLKPANVKIRPDGTVKVLDFGLAKSLDTVRHPNDASLSPTITSPVMTGIGVILGTCAYMSPEQASGKPVDKRTDIWAFGCVLFEMLTGRAAFGGNTFWDTLARILEREPDWQLFPRSTAARVRDLVRRCLQKNPEKRLDDLADARHEIEACLASPFKLPQAALESLRWSASRPAMRRVLLGISVAVVGLFIYQLRDREAPVPKPTNPPLVQHDPVSVLIADFANGTGDKVFDRTLEPMVKFALEGAGFISAHSRSDIRRNLGVRPPDELNEEAARKIAIQQGLGVVLSGSIGRQGNRYTLSVKAAQAVTGDVIAEAQESASSKDDVVPTATALANRVREALGDEESDSAKRFAMETLSATSLDVVREYAAAMDALSRGQFDEARQSFSRTLALDPKFGLGYAGLATTSWNLDRQQEAEAHAKQAVNHVERMTERERYRTRGMYYLITSDHQSCVKEYEDLIARYTADVAARNNLALCATYLRDMPRALNEMRQVVKILPNRALYRANLALYSNYSGDFQAGEQEARAMKEPGTFGLLALAFAQMGQSQIPQAIETYQALGKIDAYGRSLMASGLGDLAIYEGRFSDAERILAEGAVADLVAKDPDRAAAKFTALGNALIQHGRNGQAIAAAAEALKNSPSVKTRFLAARTFAEAGNVKQAQTLAEGLEKELTNGSQAYAKIIEGLISMQQGDPRQAIKSLTEANTLLDTWIGHFDLGRAYLDAGAPLQADSEFDRCLKRRGETLSLFLDEEPTFAFFPPVYYYQGRVRAALKADGFANSFRAYLAIRSSSREDPLLPYVRRLGGLK